MAVVVMKQYSGTSASVDITASYFVDNALSSCLFKIFSDSSREYLVNLYYGTKQHDR
jgi:hypothetical protein